MSQSWRPNFTVPERDSEFWLESVGLVRTWRKRRIRVTGFEYLCDNWLRVFYEEVTLSGKVAFTNDEDHAI